MSGIKRYLEDVAAQVHTGNRAELEDLLGSWSNEDKVNILLEAIQLNGIIGPDCECMSHKLSAYAESNSE
jgi:hypothetical protein